MWNPIAQLIKRKPQVIKTTLLGRLTTGVLKLEPSKYVTDSYYTRINRSQQDPVRIVFSGLHDNNKARYAQQALKKRYKDSTIYVFGYNQFQDALAFSRSIDPDRPVTVYGYSWGGGDARKFINSYKGNIIGAHFLDPVRRDLDQSKTLSIKKGIPVTFTQAGPYSHSLMNDIKQATVDALRFKPSRKFQLLPQVKDHVAIDDWIKNVVKHQRSLDKAATLAQYIRRDPIKIQKSQIGQALLKLLNSLPAKYATGKYDQQLQQKDPNEPVKIFFSGLPDNQLIGYARRAMQKKYGKGSVFVFGHKQLPEALEFAKKLSPETPVTVYGFSWGSTAAKDFANLYKGNLVSVHFMDPMRKAPSVNPLLKIRREVPKTFTAALPRPNRPIDAATLDVLRWKPAKDFTVLPKVKNHLALDQWLDQLNQTGLDKAAHFNKAV